MSVFEKNHRSRVYSSVQHPYRHSLTEFAFTHDAMPGVSNPHQALDWIVTVLYPRTQDPVDIVADLPSVGNTIGDYRIVTDDGDGKAAGYQWQQREGDAAAKWYKIADMDWGVSTIVSQYLLKSQDIYVYRYGYDDTDDAGDVYTGDLAGQRIYGGATANSHLILYANSGDGVGADTGYVQFGDNVRPLIDSIISLGTTTYRFSNFFTDAATVSTMSFAGGQISDTSGAISFVDENLTTTGTLSAGQITGTSFVTGTMTISAGSIVDSSGAISFGDENLSSTGSITGSSIVTGTMTLSGGSIVDTSGAISFSDENISTTGSITGGQLNADNLRLDGNTFSVTSLDGTMIIIANGIGVVDIQSAMTTIGQTVTGTMDITGQLDVDNLTLNGNTLSSTDVNGNIIFSPNGIGLSEFTSGIFPTTDSSFDIGKTGSVWNKLWIDGSIGDSTNEITIANLLTFRAVGTPNSGDALFWDGTKWVASAPDTEIDHGVVSGLGDDDHTQYVLLAGRSGGQTMYGGTGASDNLTIDSTSNVTKGNIIFGSIFRPNADGTLDIGTSGNRIHDLYIAGEGIGLRLQNATTAGRPSASASNPGRMVWDTDLEQIFVDYGGSWRAVTNDRYYEEDAVSWDGATSTATYDVSSTVNNAKEMIWCLKDNSNDYEQVVAEIDFPTNTSVRVTVGIPLAVGTYTLVGR